MTASDKDRSAIEASFHFFFNFIKSRSVGRASVNTLCCYLVHTIVF